MTKNFSALGDKMTPQARARSTAQFEAALNELQEQYRARLQSLQDPQIQEQMRDRLRTPLKLNQQVIAGQF